MKSFDEWHTGFKANANYKAAVDALRKVTFGKARDWTGAVVPHSLECVLGEITRHCYFAYQARESGVRTSGFLGDRDAVRAFNSESIQPINTAARKLWGLLNKGHKPSVQTLAVKTVLELKQRGIGLHGIDGKTRPIEQLLLELLDALEQSSKPINYVTDWCYCLLITNADSRKLPSADGALGFALVYTLRHVTTDEPFGGYGCPMPTHGRPHYTIAADFVNAALGADGKDAMTGEILKTRLARAPYKGAQWMGWAHLPIG